MTDDDRTEAGTIYVLAPVHNRRVITEAFARCLAAQTDQGFHLVLIDDGSKDGTADGVQSILSSTTVIRGSGHWWWAGSLEQARRWLLRQPSSPGDLVLIVNDDTRFEPDFLGVARSTIGRTQRTLLLAQPFSEQTGEALPLGTTIDWAKLRFTPALRPEDIDCFSTRGLFLRRTDFNELGGFHTVLLPHYLSDYEYTIRASRRGFTLRSDPSVRLVMDETSTGIRQKDHRSVWAYLRSVLTIRATANPIYWSSFVLLTSPRKFVLSNLSIVWMRFGRDLARAAGPNVVTNP